MHAYIMKGNTLQRLV